MPSSVLMEQPAPPSETRASVPDVVPVSMPVRKTHQAMVQRKEKLLPVAKTNDRDMAADFSNLADGALVGKSAGRIGAELRRYLAHENYRAVSTLAATVATRNDMAPERKADIQAAIAAALFYHGQRGEALPFATAAAKAGQPLGFWIRGLIAYGKQDWSTALNNFILLARHEALDAEQRAAANFWAARTETVLGDDDAARHYLEAAVRGGSGGFYGLLAAQRLGKAAPLAAVDGLTSARYVLPGWKPVGGFHVDRALIFALARQESRLDPGAVSPRGAHGLMQILPSTAGASRKELLDPATNLSMGQNYVLHLAERPEIDGNLLLLLAAYNSGPGKVSRWTETASSDPLWFLETIPVRETRTYVARVLTHYWAYRATLHQPLTSLAALSEGKWPRASVRDTVKDKIPTAAPLRMASAAP